MGADTYSALLGLLVMGTGNDNNNWGVNANSAVFQILEDAISGRLISSVTGGTLDLSVPAPPSGPSLARHNFLEFDGTLGSTQTVVLPALYKTWMIGNYCTGDIYVKTPSGTNTVCIPKGTEKSIFCDGTNIWRQDRKSAGQVKMFAFPGVPSGYLACDGSSLLRTSYPELWNLVGTTWGAADGTHFSVPNMIDTGRHPRSVRNGTDSVGTYYANQVGIHSHTGSVSVTVSGSTSTNGNHNHNISSSVSDPSHRHQYGILTPNGGGFASGFGNGVITNDGAGETGFAGTGISVSSSSDFQGNHSHTWSGSGSGSFTTSSSGGSENRPEGVVFSFGIKY